MLLNKSLKVNWITIKGLSNGYFSPKITANACWLTSVNHASSALLEHWSPNIQLELKIQRQTSNRKEVRNYRRITMKTEWNSKYSSHRKEIIFSKK